MKIIILLTFLLQICLNYTKTSAQDVVANCINVSINGQAEAAFTPIKNLGFGVELFTNLNNETNLFGFRIVIHLNDKKY